MPKLVAAADKRDRESFSRFRKRLQLECWTWATGLAVAFGAIIPPLLPYLDRPMLDANLSIFGIALAAVLLRIGADSYGFVLYALRRDQLIAGTSLAAVAASAAFNLTLVPLWGLLGAGLAYVAVSGSLLAARAVLSRAAERELTAR
jgi:O-antigen/teichoic acid export membrane protein